LFVVSLFIATVNTRLNSQRRCSGGGGGGYGGDGGGSGDGKRAATTESVIQMSGSSYPTER
jgi:hypothetical protein